LLILKPPSKPENILIDKGGHVKIIDFGLSKKVLDRTFTLCGTPDYIAPEIIQNKGHNKGADYWALGIIVYEMMTGLPPFYKENEEHTTFDRIILGKIRYPRWLNRDGVSLVQGLLQADVTKRYGCMKAGADDIRNHPYLKPLDWAAMLARTDDGPFKPRMRKDDDTSAFDDYTGESLPVGKPVKQADEEKFSFYTWF